MLANIRCVGHPVILVPALSTDVRSNSETWTRIPRYLLCQVKTSGHFYKILYFATKHHYNFPRLC